MKKQSVITILALMALSLGAEVPDITIANKYGFAYPGTAEIDGINTGGEWDAAMAAGGQKLAVALQNLQNTLELPTDEADSSGTYWAMWDEEGISLLFEVMDEQFPNASSNLSGGDGLEILISPAYNRVNGQWQEPGLDMLSDIHASFIFDGVANFTARELIYSRNAEQPVSQEVIYQFVKIANGYMMEVKLPWAFILGDTTETQLGYSDGKITGGPNATVYGDERPFLGFELRITDFDGDEGIPTPRSVTAWCGGYPGRIGDYAWADTKVWGTLVLEREVPVIAAPLTNESFDIGVEGQGYLAGVNLVNINAQYLPPEGTGIIGYFNNFNDSDSEMAATERWGVTSGAFVPFQVTEGSLEYGPLRTSGGKLGVATGGVPHYAPLDTSDEGLFADYLVTIPEGTNNLNGGTLIGKDGTTLYLSFLYQLNSLNPTNNQNLFSLVDTINLNRTATQVGEEEIFIRTPKVKWSFGQFWNSMEFEMSGTEEALSDYDLETHLVVVKIEYQDGADRVSVWFDPDLSKAEEEQTPVTAILEMEFNAIRFLAQEATSASNNGFSVDEIRFGQTWGDVTEERKEYQFAVVLPFSGGSVTQTPHGARVPEGTTITLEAHPSFLYEFKGWTRGNETFMDNPLVINSINTDEYLLANFTRLPCDVTSRVITDKYWTLFDEDFAFGDNFHSFLYTAFCPFVYEFGAGYWWYFYELGASEEGFFAYSYADGLWYYFYYGFKLPLTVE